jgi:hypothetical protein
MAKRARHDLPAVQEKRARVVELRGQGQTWDQIATTVGYSSGSAASNAWKAAIQQRPDLTVDDIRNGERERLEQMDSRLADIIATPPRKLTGADAALIGPGMGETQIHAMAEVLIAQRERAQQAPLVLQALSSDYDIMSRGTWALNR